MILVGLGLPADDLMAITVVGISVKPDVVITRNVIILLEASFLLWFSSLSDFIAFNPNGVAAFPKPKRFIMILVAINGKAGLFFFNSGNNFLKIGVIKWVNLFNKPDSFAIFIIPSHKHIIGINVNIRSIVLEEDNSI